MPKPKGQKTPRVPKTTEQASADNAKKWNQRQRDALPLYMQAGLEHELLQKELIVERQADHQLRQSQSLQERLAELDAQCVIRAEVFRREVKALMPARYPELLGKLRSMRRTFRSMRRPVNASDYWYTALHTHLDRKTLLDVLDRLWPEHAATLRHSYAVDHRIKRAQQAGQYNDWVVQPPKGRTPNAP